ncbi:MAG: hypothetical protein O3B95_06360, partial [Chloroflexi bacterium]|nr:hypothetical protein [Chloroflexota bacterium]
MFRQKSVIFSVLAVLLAVAVACTSATPTATPVPPTATPIPTATPEPTPTPLKPITIDPSINPVGFFAALPSSERFCFSKEVGGEERALAIIDSATGTPPITRAEAEAVDLCFSDETVESVFVGQLLREGVELSDDTITCIGEQTSGISAAFLFSAEPEVDSIISLLKGVFCLNEKERAALSASSATYGFGEMGGIDALECVVNGVGPTGLGDLMGVFSTGVVDMTAVGDLFPLMVECGAFDDAAFEESGMTVDQIGCVIDALGADALALLRFKGSLQHWLYHGDPNRWVRA